MTFLIIGLLTAAVAWFVNRKWLSNLGVYGLILAAPFLEEILKTVGAVVFRTDIFFVHAAFGTVEAVYDINTGTHNIFAGLFSFLGHIVFGYITAIIFLRSNIFFALAAGISAHIFWNFIVVFLVRTKYIK
jgi:hypothetical protein